MLVSVKFYSYTTDKFSSSALSYALYAINQLFIYLIAEHTAIRANRAFTLFTVVSHLNIMLFAFLFQSFILVHGFDELLYITDETLTFCETAERHNFPAVRALWPTLLNPRS